MTLLNSRRSIGSIALAVLLLGLWLLPIAYALPNPWGNSLIQELHESGHSYLFFVFQLALLVLLRRMDGASAWLGTGVRLMGLATAISLSAGALIEIVQPIFGRTASLTDIGRDLLGIVAGNFFYLACQRRWPLWGRGLALALALGALLLASARVFPLAKAEWMRAALFPTLTNFDEPALDLHLRSVRWARLTMVPAPRQWTGNGSRVARVVMPGGRRWPGVMLESPYPGWDGYKTLKLDVFSVNADAVRIAVNIYSDRHGRRPFIYQAFNLQPGINRLSVQLERGTPLAEVTIRNLLIYSITPEQDLTVYIDNIHLE